MSRFEKALLMKISVLVFSGVVVFQGLCARAENPAAATARVWREQHETQILQEFVHLLSLPNVAANADDVRRNATAIQRLLAARGLKARLLETPGAPPVVFGEIPAPGARISKSFVRCFCFVSVRS